MTSVESTGFFFFFYKGAVQSRNLFPLLRFAVLERSEKKKGKNLARPGFRRSEIILYSVLVKGVVFFKILNGISKYKEKYFEHARSPTLF